MEQYEHLKLPLFAENVERQKKGGGGGYKLPAGRNKSEFARQAIQDANNIKSNFTILKNKFSGNLNPTLIFEIKINQSVSPDNFEKELTRMDIHVLSVAENKRGYWVIFADDIALTKFINKIKIYGQPNGPNYDFFNTIESFQDIPADEKIGKALQNSPLGETATGFGINGMIKPELVEYGRNFILSVNHGRISEDRGGKIALLNNKKSS